MSDSSTTTTTTNTNTNTTTINGILDGYQKNQNMMIMMRII